MCLDPGGAVTVLLDTDLIPQAARAEALHAAYDGESPRRRVTVAAHPVRHRVERVELGPEAHLLRTGGSALEIVRTGRHVRMDAPEYVAIGYHRHGEGIVAAGGVEAAMPVGHLNCVDMTRPYRLAHQTANLHDVLIVSNRSAGVSVDVVRSAAPALHSSPVYDLVRTHLTGLFRTMSASPPPTQALVGQATTALIRALLTTAAEAQGRDDAMADALEARLVLFLDAHLGDQDLTLEQVAAAHNISLRHLYNVWARSGHDRSPSQWITERRLRRARDLLAAPTAGRTTIAAVARQCGFSDTSHFSRRFRATFGTTPREWRAAQQQPGGPESA